MLHAASQFQFLSYSPSILFGSALLLAGSWYRFFRRPETRSATRAQ